MNGWELPVSPERSELNFCFSYIPSALPRNCEDRRGDRGTVTEWIICTWGCTQTYKNHCHCYYFTYQDCLCRVKRLPGKHRCHHLGQMNGVISAFVSTHPRCNRHQIGFNQSKIWGAYRRHTAYNSNTLRLHVIPPPVPFLLVHFNQTLSTEGDINKGKYIYPMRMYQMSTVTYSSTQRSFCETQQKEKKPLNFLTTDLNLLFYFFLMCVFFSIQRHDLEFNGMLISKTRI